MGKRVRDVMTPGVQAVRLSSSAAEAARLMSQNDVGSLPVLGDDGAPVGIVTDRDLAVRVVAAGRDPGTTLLGDIFSGDLVTIEPDESLGEALKRMAEHKVRRLPVVEDGRLVGVLAQADVALNESPKRTGELLEEVSEPTSTPSEL